MNTAAEDVMTEISRLRDHIDADHLVMVQLGLLADAAVKMLEHVNMDTDEDRELHARATGALRGRLTQFAVTCDNCQAAHWVTPVLCPPS